MHFHMHMIPRYANGPQMVLWNPGKLDDTEKTEIIEKVKKELESDETLSQTLRLVATKKESEADIKYTVVKDGGEKGNQHTGKIYTGI
mgnify:CR=1 FL=1